MSTRPSSFREARRSDRHRPPEPRCYYGRAACFALLAKRPRDIERAFVDVDASGAADLVHTLLKSRCAFREVGPDDLDRLAQTRHHEGVVLFAPLPPWPDWDDLLEQPGPAQIAVVDEGLNPHNVGALLRSAAYFGVRAVGAVRGLVAVSGAAGRIAEGAAEAVPYARLEDGAFACRMAKARGYTVVATDMRAEQELFGWSTPQRRVVWLLGQEGRGLADELRAEADVTLAIPGSGAMESLNVSVAAGLVFGEGYRMVRSSSSAVVSSSEV